MKTDRDDRRRHAQRAKREAEAKADYADHDDESTYRIEESSAWVCPIPRICGGDPKNRSKDPGRSYCQVEQQTGHRCHNADQLIDRNEK